MAEYVLDYDIDEDDLGRLVEHEAVVKMTGSSWAKRLNPSEYRLDAANVDTPDDTTKMETSLVDLQIPTKDNEQLSKIANRLQEKGLTWHHVDEARRNARRTVHRHTNARSSDTAAASPIQHDEEGSRRPISSIGQQRVAKGNAPWVRDAGVPRATKEGKQGPVKVEDREGVTGVAVKSGKVTVYNEHWDKMSKRQKIRHRSRVSRQARKQLPRARM